MPRPQKKNGLLFVRQNTKTALSPDVPKENILSLRKKTWLIEFHPEEFKIFFDKHFHALLVIGALVVGTLILGASFKSSAHIATFYPETCLGGWENPALAAGIPEIKDGSLSEMNEKNSAVLKDSHSQIFCSTFVGEIPEYEMPEKVTLKFSWNVTKEPVFAPSVDETSEGIITAPIDATEETAEETNEPAPEVQEETPAPTPDVTPEPEAVPTENPVPETVRLWKLPFAFAQETEAPAAEPAVEVAPAPEPTEPIIEEPVVDQTPPVEEESEEIIPEQNGAEETTQTETPEIPPQEAILAPIPEVISVDTETHSDDFMVVKYTVDGENWETLGTVTHSNWQSVEFEIPHGKAQTWKDISNVQISLTPVQSIDETPLVYLESVALITEYEALPELENLPKVSVTGDLGIFDAKKSFSPSEVPTFIISDPELSIEDVAVLIKEDKAEIVEDKKGIMADAVLLEENKVEVLPAEEELFDVIQEKLPDIAPDVVSYFHTKVAHAAEGVQILDATILDWEGNATAITATITTIVVDGVEKQKVTINAPEWHFRPGRYTLQITLMSEQVILITHQDFSWGVLAVNVDKSIYQPEDSAYIQMGVLDEKGNTICNAELALAITTPSGIISNFSTQNNTITQDGACGPNNVIDVPDYHMEYSVPTETGTYKMELTATTENGSKTVWDEFRVAANPMFDVQRSGPTRIYPVAKYPVTLRIKATTAWSGKVVDSVPSSFAITPPQNSLPYESVTTVDDQKIISWDLELDAGEVATLGYYFDAPDVSPEFYFIGPLKFLNANGSTMFQEVRQWQIASDVTCTASGTGNWNTSGTWSCGHVPTTGEDVVIDTTGVVTMDVNSAVLASITVNGSLNTSNGTSRSLSGTTLTIGSTGTLTANASTITLSGTTGTIFTLTSGGTFTAGTSNVVFSGSGAGLALTSGSITFSTLSVTPSIAVDRTYTLNDVALNATTFTLRPANTNRLTLNLGASLTVSGTSTISRQNSSASTLDTTGSNHPFTTGLLAFGASSILKANGSTITITGTNTLVTTIDANSFDAGTSHMVVTSTSGVVFNQGVITTYDLSFTGTGTRRLSTTSAVTVNHNLSVTNGTLNSNGTGLATGSGTNVLSVGSGASIQVGASTFGANFASFETVSLDANSTVDYNLNGTQTIDHTLSYGNLTVSVGGTKTLDGATVVAGTTTVTLGTLDTDNTNSYALTTGKISIANSASAILTVRNSIVTLTATSGTLYTKGANGVFTVGGSTFVVTSVSGTPTLLSVATTFHILTINSAATVINAGAAITINDAAGAKLYVQSGVLNDSGFGIATSASTTNTLQLGSTGVLCLGGAAGANTSATCNTGAASTTTRPLPTFSTYTFDPASTIRFMSDAATTISNTPTYGNLHLAPVFVSTSRTYTLGGAMTINGDFDIFPEETGAGTPALTVNAAGAITLPSTKTTKIRRANSATSVLDLRPVATDYDLTTGLLDVDTGGTLDATSAASIITLSATSGTLFAFAGTFTITSGTPTVILTGNGDATVNSGTPTFYNLTSSGSGVKTLGAGITVNNTLTLSAGTFDPSTFTVTGTGTNTMTVSNATARVGASTWGGSYSSFETRNMNVNSTVDYFLNGTQTIDSTLAYVNLTTSTGGTKSLNGATTATDTVTVNTSSTLDTTGSNHALNSVNLVINGTLLGNGSTITLSGNWTNAGTFTAGSSTVLLNTATTATVGGGPTTFNNLTITHSAAKEVRFSTNALHIITVSGTFTVTGSVANLIKLYSTSGGTKWHFKPTGTSSVDYADIKDGGCESGSNTVTATNSTDSGNNESCWSFGVTPSASFAISDTTLFFGKLSSSIACFAQGSDPGLVSCPTTSETEAHTLTASTNATSGYSILINGTTLTSGGYTITAIGGTNVASSPGTKQFGLRMTATGGSGAVSAPYSGAGFALDTASFPDEVANASSGDSVTTTYSVRYITNISSTTEPGDYTSTLMYILVPNF